MFEKKQLLFYQTISKLQKEREKTFIKNYQKKKIYK
jgi:hypothetical protein